MTFETFPIEVTIDWSKIENIPLTIEDGQIHWDEIVDKPTVFNPPDNPTFNTLTCELLRVFSSEGGTSYIGWGANGDTYLSTGANGELYHRKFGETIYNISTPIWHGHNFNPTSKADVNHVHFGIPIPYNSATSDNITNIVNGSTGGYVTKATNSGHHVFGLQNNNGLDSFAIVGSDFITADNQPYSRVYFRTCDDYTQIRTGHGATGSSHDGQFTFLPGGEIAIKMAVGTVSIKPTSVIGGVPTEISFFVGNTEVLKVWKSPHNNGVVESANCVFETAYLHEARVIDSLILGNAPTYNNAASNEVYVDANGFLKLK